MGHGMGAGAVFASLLMVLYFLARAGGAVLFLVALWRMGTAQREAARALHEIAAQLRLKQ